MANQSPSEIIENHPIGKGLDAFRASFNSICEDRSILCSLDALDQLDPEDSQTLVINLLATVQTFTASRFLPSKTGHTSLRTDVIRLSSTVDSTDFNFDCVKPLLKSALADETDDTLLWDQVYQAVTEHTPPPRLVASSIQQTPWLRNTSSFANSSEHRKYVDDVLKEELGSMYVGLCKFHETYFGNVADLETASETFFKQCQEGSNPLFDEGWSGWPKDAKQDDVLSWFADFTEKLSIFAEGSKSTSTRQRRPLAKPNEPIDGSIGKRKMDVGFVNDPAASKDSRCHWSQILVPGELKKQREGSSGAKGKTGTRAFMAIGVLLGEQHSFMHDLESFFWVLFWICIHYNTPNESRVVPKFDKWNYADMEELAISKTGVVAIERDFLKIAEVNFTPYYHPFIPWVNRLRRIVFPNGERWVREDKGLYTRMREILLEAGKDPDVLADK
ncbi:hypothetical protein CFIMG_005936RA [Ceratocystis fimbriata CBS 114723]|uniref:Fungal-type protein kinase domain-containing protein n=1 Tax=Ceratocystis fimbriata CBS 114723 TaxID=1035309 RepID=A0A2C5WSM6_9PEZI|nr:hypothetical protein CFIMG_005936RA [Ceratocystis fimbriata CBS 114723]